MSNNFKNKNINLTSFNIQNNNNNQDNSNSLIIYTNSDNKLLKSSDNIFYHKNLIAQYMNQEKEIKYLQLKLLKQNKVQNQIKDLKSRIIELNHLLESKNKIISCFEELTNLSKQKLEFLKFNNQIKTIEITENVKHLKNLNFNKNYLLNSLKKLKSSNINLKQKIRYQSSDNYNTNNQYKIQLNNFNNIENLEKRISNYENVKICNYIEKGKNKLDNLNKKLRQKNKLIMEIDDCNNRMIYEIEILNNKYQEKCNNINKIIAKIQSYDDICNKYENYYRKKKLDEIYKNDFSLNNRKNDNNILNCSCCSDTNNINRIRNNYFPLNINNNINHSFF